VAVDLFSNLFYVTENFSEDLVKSIITLFVVMDPIGSIPIILGLTQRIEKSEKRKLVLNAIVAVTVLLFVFAFFGSQILSLLGVDIFSFMIAGGVLLFIVAIEFLTHGEWRIGGGNIQQESGIVPLAFPLLSGPGALTVVMISFQTVGLLVTLVSISVAVVLTFITLMGTEQIYKILGKRGTILVTRVFAIFIAAFAIQFIIDGIQSIF
jgi:multiple antibiotic resistance protein